MKKYTGVVWAVSLVSALLIASHGLAITESEGTNTNTNVNTNTNTNANAVKVRKRNVDLACMQAAVEKRDNAIIAAVDKYQASVKKSLETRRDALKAAWGITDVKARRAALKTAWKDFKGTWKKAFTNLRTDKKAAWKQFYTDRKACGPSAASDDATHEGVDAQL